MSDGREVDGVIESAQPRGLFRIRTDEGQVVTAQVSAEARRVTVKFLPGDRVTIEVSPYDPSRGRITAKHS